MPFDLTDCQFTGPALPEPFVRFELEKELTRLKLLAKTTGSDGKQLKDDWEVYRRHLAQLAVRGGPVRVRNHAIEPILRRLGYDDITQQNPVETREGRESGGHLLTNGDDSTRLRVWITGLDEDLDAPAKRGRAYRFSHLRIAQRVLLASGERVGLLTNGVEMRLLISDPARPDSQVIIPVNPGWKRSRDVPDSFRFLLALASPDGVNAVPELVDKARLQQARVTKELRGQARKAVQRFVQEVLDHPANREWLDGQSDRQSLARDLWHEGLVIVYRLLFVLKLESSDDPARLFSFASTALWRNTFSPSMALARFAHPILDEGAETGGLLEGGLRTLFKMFDEGVQCTELNVKPLGGALFGAAAAPLLARLRWGERAVAHLLDQLLWTTPKRKKGTRERVHYGPLDVEDLGRVYEALLELEPGITAEPMCRLRRQKLEVVVPMAQGEKYRPHSPLPLGEGQGERSDIGDEADDVDDAEEEEADEDEAPRRSKKTTVQWIEEIPPQKFYLRVGLGRKASGSYYTPHSFVRFLVQETLGPQVAERSPHEDPRPAEILKLKVLDPAMGSGHFLVEACRFLGHHLYEAARLCDERALQLEREAERAKGKAETHGSSTPIPSPQSPIPGLLAEARDYRQRIIDLPDPDDEIVRYLPSRSPEGEESGISQRKAEALCRRMVAVHCLYGVDKNPLAVELAKLALWLESHAEGMPLTFLDHRLVVGDSLTGPFWDKLIMRPSNPKEPIEGVFHQGLTLALQKKLAEALSLVRHLEATVGVSLSEVEEKERLKAELDQALRPFRIIAAAWSGGVMLGPEKCDDLAYADLLKAVAETGDIPSSVESERLRAMIARGLDVDEVSADRNTLYGLLASGHCVPALAYDLAFPEVFYPTGVSHGRHGYDAVVGNPPWDVMEVQTAEVLSIFNPRIARGNVADYADYLSDSQLKAAANALEKAEVARDESQRAVSTCVLHGRRATELSLCFSQRFLDLSSEAVGVVLPDGFHRNKEGVWVREGIFRRRRLKRLAGFVNSRRLFSDLPPVVQFDLIVVGRPQEADHFLALFKAESDEVLTTATCWLDYPWEFALNANPQFLTLLEVRSTRDAYTCAAAYTNCKNRFSTISSGVGIDLSQEVNKRSLAPSFQQIEDLVGNVDVRDGFNGRSLLFKGGIGLLEGRSIQIYDLMWQGDPASHWNPVPTLALRLDYGESQAASKCLVVLPRLRFYRLFARQTCGSPMTNERSAVFCFAPPGLSAVHSIIAEATAHIRPNWRALFTMSIANSYVFDFLIRLQVGPNLSKFILETIPAPNSAIRTNVFFCHGSMRISAQHFGYEPLWREQVGEAWREPGKEPFTWPVLAGDDERWEVRAAIDAVVADAYGLSRDQYKHVLSTFSHASYKKAPELCLARFDELKTIGLDAFTRKHDPYHDIPLNENLPQPVIDLPIPRGDEAEAVDDDRDLQLTGKPKPQKRGRKKK